MDGYEGVKSILYNMLMSTKKIHHERGTKAPTRIIPLVDISQPRRGTRGTWMEWLVAEIEAMNELNKWTPTYQSWSSYCVRDCPNG